MGGQHNTSAALPWAKKSGSHCTEVWVVDRLVWTCSGKVATHRDLIHGPPSSQRRYYTDCAITAQAIVGKRMIELFRETFIRTPEIP